MQSRKEKLIQVFDDTQVFYKENPTLAAAVEYGRENTQFYEADEYPSLPVVGTPEQLWERADCAEGSLAAQASALADLKEIENGAPFVPAGRMSEVRISKDRTFEAAMKLSRKYPGKKVAVLNFASAVNPGGGVKMGAGAQEESLCRCSTLFPTIDRKWLFQKYYNVNRAAGDHRFTDAIIYSPDVVICKTDESIPRRLREADFVTVDVITCAAPDLRNRADRWKNPEILYQLKRDPSALYEIQYQRICHILHIAAAHKVDILVLGAFGCGAFENDPNTVGSAFYSAVRAYQNRFDLIEFAIFCQDEESRNYKAFREKLKFLLSFEEDPDEKQSDGFVFFWMDNEENGCFSQWYQAKMVIDGVEYANCEQYMMAKKALAMGDIEYYILIMHETDPAKVKQYGREVRGFDSAKWAACAPKIIYDGNYAKFTQNEELKRRLLATGDAILAEASPYDKIYGIGLSADDPAAKVPEHWKGKNLMGKTLMNIREELRACS